MYTPISISVRSILQIIRMKVKLSFLGLLFIVLASFTETQAQAHYQGQLTFNPALGLGTYGYYGAGLGLPLIFKADFGVHDYVDVGPYGGLILANNTTSISFGGRANFNFWQLIDENTDADLASDAVDFYLSAFLGWEIGDLPDRLRGGSTLGVKWWFSDPLGLMVEVGGGPVSYSEFGLAIRVR